MSDHAQRLYDALKTITCYDPPHKLRKRSQRDYGLDGDEAIEYAYENVLQEARNAIRGMRRPKSTPLPKPHADKPRKAAKPLPPLQPGESRQIGSNMFEVHFTEGPDRPYSDD